MTSSKTLIVIVGPTAIGKTSLSLAFAKAYKTHILSCDSRQFFKEMSIGTAVPTINKRVDLMLEMGLETEAKEQYEFKNLNALKTVGYQEFYGHFDGNYSHEEAIRLIKRNTRRFAKRQLTWYRKDPDVTWFPYRTRHTDIVQRVRKELMD